MNNTFTLTRKNDKLKAIFDMDDVMADLVPCVLTILNEIYGRNFKVEDVISWHLDKLYGEDISHVFKQPGLFKNLKPKNDVLLEFPKIYNNPKFDVWIVTACNLSGYIEKLEWLKFYFPDFPLSRVLPCEEKDTVWADVIVDDGLHNLKAFENIGEPIVYDMAHNRYTEDGKPVTYKRVYCFRDIRKYLEAKVSRRKMQIA